MNWLRRQKSNLQLVAAVICILLCNAGINYLILGKVQLCMWRSICGFPCPGCGLTHAGLFLMTGNIRDSFNWHPFFIPMVLTFAISSIPPGWNKWADKFRNQKIWYRILLGLVTIYFLYRLVFIYPQNPEAGPMHYDNSNYLYQTWKWFSN